MICGESAGIDAQAIDEKVPVQDINVAAFSNSLKKAGQVIG